MIIGFRNKLNIGDVIREGRIADIHGILHNQPFIVLRESNFEEWKECFLSLGGTIEDFDSWLSRNLPRNRGYPYYYEIQTD